jgi:exodeoxyribonuclease V alpha subunit
VPLGQAKIDGSDDAPSEEKTNTGCCWDLAYACTVHKYQGSECPVVIVLVEASRLLASRQLLYTAVSRAKELCILIGSNRNISSYLRNDILPNRKTFLTDLIRGEK